MLLNKEEIDDEVRDVLGPLALDGDIVEELISEIMLLDDVVIDEELIAIVPIVLDDVDIDEEPMAVVPLVLLDDIVEELISEIMLLDDDIVEELISENMLLDDVAIDEELMAVVPLALSDDTREVELAAEGLPVADDGKPDEEVLGPAPLEFDGMEVGTDDGVVAEVLLIHTDEESLSHGVTIQGGARKVKILYRGIGRMEPSGGFCECPLKVMHPKRTLMEVETFRPQNMNMFVKGKMG